MRHIIRKILKEEMDWSTQGMFGDIGDVKPTLLDMVNSALRGTDFQAEQWYDEEYDIHHFDIKKREDIGTKYPGSYYIAVEAHGEEPELEDVIDEAETVYDHFMYMLDSGEASPEQIVKYEEMTEEFGMLHDKLLSLRGVVNEGLSWDTGDVFGDFDYEVPNYQGHPQGVIHLRSHGEISEFIDLLDAYNGEPYKWREETHDSWDNILDDYESGDVFDPSWTPAMSMSFFVTKNNPDKLDSGYWGYDVSERDVDDWIATDKKVISGDYKIYTDISQVRQLLSKGKLNESTDMGMDWLKDIKSDSPISIDDLAIDGYYFTYVDDDYPNRKFYITNVTKDKIWYQYQEEDWMQSHLSYYEWFGRVEDGTYELYTSSDAKVPYELLPEPEMPY